MLKELIEYGNNIKEERNLTLSEIKKNLQGTNSREDEAENQINYLEWKKGKSIQSEQQEEKIIQKMRIGLVTSRTSLNVPTSKS